MALHNEIEFEKEICDHLGSHGWIYEDGAAADYDRKRALYPPDLFAWLEQAQQDSWENYKQKNGSKSEQLLLQRLRDVLQQTGTLDLLRKGLEVAGPTLKLAAAILCVGTRGGQSVEKVGHCPKRS